MGKKELESQLCITCQTHHLQICPFVDSVRKIIQSDLSPRAKSLAIATLRKEFQEQCTRINYDPSYKGRRKL